MRSSVGRQGHLLGLGVGSSSNLILEKKKVATFKLELKPFITKLYLYHKYLDVWLKLRIKVIFKFIKEMHHKTEFLTNAKKKHWQKHQITTTMFKRLKRINKVNVFLKLYE